MSRADDPTGDVPVESFQGLILRLRGRIGLTQRELATQIGVHVTSIRGWEAGSNFPGVTSLKALIVVGLEAGGFAAGYEREEARDIWSAALRDAPRFRMPFDDAWFARLGAGREGPAPEESARTAGAPASAPLLAGRSRRESWGVAPDVAAFLGRADERGLLRQWVLDERCRVVAVLGLGGMGKSLLTTRVAQDLAPSFAWVIWRSLRDAPTPGEWLADVLGLLAPNDPSPAQAEPAQVRRLLELLSEARCLLVLDNFETVLQPGGRAGEFRPGYERFGTLLRQVAEAPHQSCVVLTSREEPLELGPLRGERGPVRVMALAGLPVEDGRALLRDKHLDGNDAAWQALVGHCGGNSLALKVVGETTREVFGGSIAEFLAYVTATAGVTVGGVRQLLQEQMQRLSTLEQELLCRMAVEREPISLADLAAQLGPRIGRAATLDALEGLRRRSLLERAEGGATFGLHSVVLEYVTDALIEDVVRELASCTLDLVLRQPLLKATAKEYVRRSQERLIGAAIVERLIEHHGRARAVEQRLVSLLDKQRGRPVEEQGYGPGNLVNLLRLLRGDLRGVDLSGLAIRQAYLQDVEAHGASLAGATLVESVLGEAFSYANAVAVSADGACLAAGTASGEVCFWRVADRTLLTTFPGHTGGVWGVALSGDGRLLASGGVDGTVRLWDAERTLPLAILRGHSGGVRDVALNEDGRLVASGGDDGTVRLWEVEGEREVAILRGHAGDVYAVALSGDGRLVASASLDGTVRLWDVGTGRSLHVLTGHVDGVWGVALSRDGRLLVSGGTDGTVRLWDADAGRLLATLDGHTGGVRGVALSGDDSLVASCSVDGTIRLWEARSGLLLTTLQGHTGTVRGVALNGDGRLVASGSFDGTIRLWETASGRSLAALSGHTSGVWGVALSRDGRLIASSGANGTVWVWDASGGPPLATLQGHTSEVYAVALSGDGRLAASGGLDGTVRVWTTAEGSSLAVLHGHSGGVWGVALSGDGRLLASAGDDGVVRLWDVDGGRALAALPGHSGLILGVALSGDGRLVASGGVDGTIRLWEAATGNSLATLQAQTGTVRGVALDGTGRLLASGSFDGAVHLWDAASGQRLAMLRGHTGAVRGVALSADGRIVASVSFDGTARLWEAGSGRSLAVLRGHIGGVWGVALRGDGQVVASGGDDGTVRLWDVRSGVSLRTLRLKRRYEALDITGLSGITGAQRGTLLALGAVERRGPTAPPA